MSDTAATRDRLALLAGGYWPIPLRGKDPFRKGWQETHTNPDEIRLWEQSYPDATNTGVLCELTPALDIDLYNPEAAAAVEELANQHFADRGMFLPRVGQWPKRAILLRTDEPFAKIQLLVKAPNSAEDAKPDKIEILGDGQQLVVAGIHPDTRKPYTWNAGTPCEIPRADLPYCTREDIQKFVDEVGALLVREFGYQIVGGAAQGNGNGHGGGGTSTSLLIQNILTGRDFHDSDTVLAAQLISKGIADPDVEALIRGLYHSSTAPRDARWHGRVNDIPRGVKSARKFAPETASKTPDFLTPSGFVGGFIPPEYLVDGMVQRRFVYSLTGQTGHAKTALALLLAEQVARIGDVTFGPHAVAKGHVVYFAGENPDDLRMRVIGANSFRGEDWKADTVTFIPGIFEIPKITSQVADHAKTVGGVALVVIDTSAAYFLGQDEISNTEMGRHARMLRALTELPGGPCVLVLCHPIKYVTEVEQLLPRGGGAFLAEMDGNLTCMKHDDTLVELHHGKIRGAGFEPITFRLETIRTDALADAKGRQIPTVRAVAISQAEEDKQADTKRQDENQVLVARLKDPDATLSNIAEMCGWLGRDGSPLKARVGRVFTRLEKAKPSLAVQDRGQWRLTEKGRAAAIAAGLKLRDTQGKGG